MVNGQMNQATGGAPDSAVAFTAGEGTNNLEVHDTNGNLDTTSGNWSIQGIAEHHQNKGDIPNLPNNEGPIENASNSIEKNNSVSMETTATHMQNQPAAHVDGSKTQPNAAALATASINKAAITEEKFGKNGVREFNKIIHLMTDDLNNGEKLADAYDLARDTNIAHLSKHGAQSSWIEEKAA